MEEQKITAMMIIEVMGRPKEHLLETLEKMADSLKKEHGVELIEKKINEPVEIKDKKDIFSTFLEVEIKVPSLKILSNLMFGYMPSHVEIVEPENLKLSNNDAGDMLTGITQKLHKYDEIAKVLEMQNMALENKLKHLENKN